VEYEYDVRSGRHWWGPRYSYADVKIVFSREEIAAIKKARVEEHILAESVRDLPDYMDQKTIAFMGGPTRKHCAKDFFRKSSKRVDCKSQSDAVKFVHDLKAGLEALRTSIDNAMRGQLKNKMQI
jgi:hypothetical protein